MRHSKSCNKQRQTTGKCICGNDKGLKIPEHIPADEVPIYKFMVKYGQRDSMSFYLDIKQMINEIAQARQ